jgi:hypothetical protein
VIITGSTSCVQLSIATVGLLSLQAGSSTYRSSYMHCMHTGSVIEVLMDFTSYSSLSVNLRDLSMTAALCRAAHAAALARRRRTTLA